MKYLGLIFVLVSIFISAGGKWVTVFKDIQAPQKKGRPRVQKSRNANRQKSSEDTFAFEEVTAETKTTASHTQRMREMFSRIVTVLQQTSLEERSLSVFDMDLLEKLTSLSDARIQLMRRSEIVINSEKLKRLYQNNPDLPIRTLESIREYLQSLEELQSSEEQVQHMGQKGELTVEAVRSAASLHRAKKKIQIQSDWRQAIITSEILQKPKSLK